MSVATDEIDRDTHASSPPERVRRTTSLVVLVPWLVVLVVVIPALVVTQVADSGRSQAWKLSLIVLVWSGARLAWLIGRGQVRFFSFFFWLFCYVFMGLASAIQIRANQPSTTTSDVLPSLDESALGVVLLGMACFELGSLLGGLLSASRGREEAATRAEPGLPARVDLGRTVLLWLAGMTTSLYYVSRMGLAVLGASRDAAADARAELWPSVPVQAAVLALATYPTLVSVGGFMLRRRVEPRASRRLGYLLLSLAGVAMLCVVVSPFSSARYPLGTVFFGLVLIFGAARTRARVRATLSAVVLGLFFLFPVADAFRRNQPNFARAGFFAEYAGNPDYDSIWQIANAVTIWTQGHVEAGRQALGVVLFFVPRSVWPDKPIDTGILLANYFGYKFTNLSAPLWAEAMVNGGIVAVVLVFVLVGFFLRKMDTAVARAQHAADLWFVAGSTLAAYLLIILRGSLLQATGTVVVILACVLFARGRRPSAPRPGTPPRE